MTDAEPDKLGPTLAKLRRARGLNQQEVAARIPTYYSDGAAYGRVERAGRHPDRDYVVAILIKGLLIRDVAEINRVLNLAGFVPLGAGEIETLRLEQPVTETPAVAIPALPVRAKADQRWAWVTAGSLVLTGLIASFLPIGSDIGFVVVTSCIYAGLYVVSLYLESAYDPEHQPTTLTAASIFGIMSVGSAVALVTDWVLVDSGNSLGLLVSLLVFIATAVAQFAIVRPALAVSALVPAKFQTRTAQGAHLKNTSYFLIVVLVFWLPSFHCVSTLSREARLGHADLVRQMLMQDLILGHGVLALSVHWLLASLFVALMIALYMGAYLLDNLREHPRLNRYTLLLYLRAGLYFLLCLLCFGWYASSLSDFG